MKYSYRKYPLHFAFDARTSRGAIQTHTAYIIEVSDGVITGLGEASPLAGLSIDAVPEFETFLQESLNRLSEGEKLSPLNLEHWPALNFGLETALLDFENGIEKELVAATFVGGQFNLSQARALAYAGKHVDAQKEILRQIERSGKFSDQDMFTKKALADAAGMTVEQITKQLLIQEKLGDLSEVEQKRMSAAMDKGLDITNMTDDQLKAKTQQLAKEEEIADKITQMENSFKGIVASVGEGLLPLMEALAPVVTIIGNVFGGIFKVLNYIPGLFPAIIAGLTTMYILSKKTALLKMKEALMSAWTNSKMGVIGIALAVGATAAIMAAYSKGGTDVGDMAIKSGKGVQISTEEGGIFNPSPNDQIAVAPNAISKLKEASNATQPSILSMGMGGSDKAVNALITEMKALRADMSSGKIVTNTFLDGQKVMAGIAASSERSSRNNFTYGQR